jgi:hypothetical protein
MHYAVCNYTAAIAVLYANPPAMLNQCGALLLHFYVHLPPQTWSAWFVADSLQGRSGAAGAAKLADALRRWMGDALQTEQVPTKCAARLGQCFSTTVDAAEVQQHQTVGATARST